MKHLLFGLGLLSSVTLSAQMMRDDVSLSDPFVLPDPVSETYFMTGTGGDIFQSLDLEVWTKLPWALNTNGIDWIGANHTAPSPGKIWAPELYYKDGDYYDVVTFTNDNATTEGTNHSRRSVHILKSDKPNGPYKKIEGGDAIYLPASKMAIDGSIWEEDGRLYLVYCYEWVQAGDGAIEYVELKSDLTGTIGESHHICKASDGRAWNTDAVTDGPYLFRTQTGRLGMIWTGWRSGVYVQSVSYSDNGKINGKWTHSKCPITPDNHGHGMLFRTFDGQLLMSIHSNRNIDLNAQHFERHPVFFVMDDSGDELRAVMQYKHKYDVTSPAKVVVLNAGFDYSTTGWTCTSDAMNQKIASNQSGAITGNFYENWDADSYTGEIYQTLSVPNGTYRLTAAAFRNSLITGAVASDDAVCLFANDEVCNVTSTDPQNFSVTVFVTDGTLRFGIRSNKKNYKWMGIDNVDVTYYGAERVSADEIDGAQSGPEAVYLRNKSNGLYLNCGNSWGTQAVFSPHPMDLYVEELPNGRFVIDTRVSNGGGNHYVGSNGYMDGAMAEFMMPRVDSLTCALTTNGKAYWGANSGSLLVATNLSSPSSKAAHWEKRTKQDLLADFANATENTPVDATFLIKGQNFGRNDTRIAANWTGAYTLGGDVKNQCVQAPASAYSISQTIKNVPNGFYELRVQGFYRHGSATLASNYLLKGKESIKAYLFANDEQTALQSIFAHANHSSIPSDGTDATESGKIPSTLEAASAMFSAGLYNNKLLVEVTDGKLTVGVKKTTGTTPSNNWTVFDNFELYYLGTEAPTSIETVTEDYSHPAQRGVYALMGRKVASDLQSAASLPGGIYIVDGKKMVLNMK